MFMSFNQFRSVMKNERQVNMNVGSVNQLAFVGKTKTTKNGNEYKKTNTGKIAGLSIAGGFSLLPFVGKEFRNKLISSLKEPKGTAAQWAVGSAAFAIVLGSLGAIVDGMVNHHRRKKADKAVMA